MKVSFKILCLIAPFLVAASCNSKGKLTKLKSGISYRIVTKGKGTASAKEGDVMQIHIRAYVSDSMLFDSYKLNDNKPVPAIVAKPQFNGDIMEVLALLKEGDSCIASVEQDSIFRQGATPPSFAKKGDSVKYQIKVLSLKSKEDFDKETAAKSAEIIKKEASIIDNYIAKEGLTNVKKLPSGIVIVTQQAGSGPNVPNGSEVTMNYTGMLLNGEKFDSNVLPEFSHVEPFQFKLGQGMVIKGWDQGIAELNKGAKARLIIPSPLAYGENSPSPKIPANSILVFDVEVVNFR